jgi:hypothetical protein
MICLLPTCVLQLSDWKQVDADRQAALSERQRQLDELGKARMCW